ncbi:hypothetical protein [Rhodococcus globerulus]|uniref:Uncharacterized protein n=1 Tax=Rhodococcus globerulus TaxID=33008 RepID=A0ABU4BS55_RHOGO|nr:hypothetical protein [Rhodococcus globerulus]MDV6267030.1 hypothetical protein [Rhodococcus globerulus]
MTTSAPTPPNRDDYETQIGYFKAVTAYAYAHDAWYGEAGNGEQAARERHPAGKGIAKSDDPAASARYDRALNMIALSVDGTDDVYLDRDNAFGLGDQLRIALETQAKLGGAS